MNCRENTQSYTHRHTWEHAQIHTHTDTLSHSQGHTDTLASSLWWHVGYSERREKTKTRRKAVGVVEGVWGTPCAVL